MENCFVNLHRLHYSVNNGTLTLMPDFERENCHECNRLRQNIHKRKHIENLNCRQQSFQRQRQRQFDHGPCSSHSRTRSNIPLHNIGNCYVNLHRIQFNDLDGGLLPVSEYEQGNCTRCTIHEGSCSKQRKLESIELNSFALGTGCLDKGIAHDFLKFFEFSSAAYEGNLDAIKKFLSDGFVLQVPEYRGWTVIHTCIFANKPEALRVILNHNSLSKQYLSNLSIWEGSSLLYLSILRDGTSTEIIKTLLESGADPNKCTNEGFSPLHLACYKKRSIELVKLLVSYGADVNARESKIRYTPLHFAIDVTVDHELLEYLVNICDVNVEDALRKTPLFKACSANFLEAVKLILQKDPTSVNQIPISNISPLTSAAATGNLEMVKWLLEAGADTSYRGRAKIQDYSLFHNDFIPLHSSLTNIEVFKLILSKTDPKDIRQPNISFPVFVATYAPQSDFFEALLEHNFPSNFSHLNRLALSDLIDFVKRSHDVSEDKVLEKFLWFFKYYSFEPEVVFDAIVDSSEFDDLLRKSSFLLMLARMGMPWREVAWERRLIIRLWSNWKGNAAIEKVTKETISKLNEPVLSLMQLSRIAFRRYARKFSKNDLSAYYLIKNSCLPNVLKEYLWYQVAD